MGRVAHYMLQRPKLFPWLIFKLHFLIFCIEDVGEDSMNTLRLGRSKWLHIELLGPPSLINFFLKSTGRSLQNYWRKNDGLVRIFGVHRYGLFLLVGLYLDLSCSQLGGWLA